MKLTETAMAFTLRRWHSRYGDGITLRLRSCVPTSPFSDIAPRAMLGVSGRLWLLLDAVLDLSATRCASPAATAAYLGATQWYDLFRRLKLSVFSRVYGFCSGSLATDWTQRLVPSEVILELLLDAALHAFCTVDMRRPHLPFLGATDASTSFGLGATVARMSCSDLRRIARLSCKAGGHVMMEAGPPLPQRPCRRLGPRHNLGLDLRDFRVVLSIRRGSPDHVNLEEARALICYVQWILRTRRHFGHRLVVLLDSKVAIGAVTKGRSASLPLNRLLRRFGRSLLRRRLGTPLRVRAHEPQSGRLAVAWWASKLAKRAAAVFATSGTRSATAVAP